jgi:magnesium transporter
VADAAALTFAFMRSHPAEAAHVLEGAPPHESVDLLARVPVRIGSAVLAEMLPRMAALALLGLPSERAIELLAHLDARSSVGVLRHIEEPSRSQLIAGLPTPAALAAKLLLEFIEDSVGSCMDPNVIALPMSSRALEALDRVRVAETQTEWIFAVDGERRLLGWIPLAGLMRAPQAARLETLLLEPPARLAAHAPLAGARTHPGWLSASTLPVVDRGGRLIGEMTRDALDRASQRAGRRVSVQAADESLAGMLVQGYWQSLSGMLELLASCLPAARPHGWRDHER